MENYLLICRSLTYAQRTAKALERSGISSMVIRIPSALAKEGCGYCVRISAKRLSQTLITLKKAELSPLKIYASMDDGKYSEVPV